MQQCRRGVALDRVFLSCAARPILTKQGESDLDQGGNEANGGRADHRFRWLRTRPLVLIFLTLTCNYFAQVWRYQIPNTLVLIKTTRALWIGFNESWCGLSVGAWGLYFLGNFRIANPSSSHEKNAPYVRFSCAVRAVRGTCARVHQQIGSYIVHNRNESICPNPLCLDLQRLRCTSNVTRRFPMHAALRSLIPTP